LRSASPIIKNAAVVAPTLPAPITEIMLNACLVLNIYVSLLPVGV